MKTSFDVMDLRANTFYCTSDNGPYFHHVIAFLVNRLNVTDQI